MSGRCRTQIKRDLSFRSSGCHRGLRQETDPRHSGAHRLSLKLPEKLSYSVVFSHTHRMRASRADLYDAAGGTGLQAGLPREAIYRFGMGKYSPIFISRPPSPREKCAGFNLLPRSRTACLRQKMGRACVAWGWRTKMRGDGRGAQQPTNQQISTITSTKGKILRNWKISAPLNSNPFDAVTPSGRAAPAR